MTALLTVHGTFAGGEAKGEKWWQTNSDFETDVRRFVDTKDAHLNFIPVRWDGENSEDSRRAAGRDLLNQMLKLEAASEQYSVIGHSHGGSVISLSLLEAVNRGLTLPGLKKWITVGTPFIELQKKRLLFSRVSHFGKSTLVSLFTLFLLFVLAFYLSSMNHAFNLFNLALLLTPFIIIYLMFLYLSNRLLHIYRQKNWLRFAEHFADRWLALNHPDDEAIEGLGGIRHLKLRIFGDRFAVPLLTFVGANLIPLTLLVFIFSPSLVSWLETVTGRENRFGDNTVASTNVEYIADLVKLTVQSLATYIHEKMEFAFSAISDESVRFAVEGGISLFTLIVIPILAIVSASYVLLAVIRFIAIGISYLLSRLLNRITWSQIRATAYGNDTLGEIAIGANKSPFWMKRQPAPLPSSLAELLSNLSDEAAAKALPQLRASVKKLALAEGGDGEPDAFTEYLTWDELIYTAYFRLPKFRKLVAYALATSPGFEESETLKSEADYQSIRAWLAEIADER